jgi:class 3 adenylate cyclase
MTRILSFSIVFACLLVAPLAAAAPEPTTAPAKGPDPAETAKPHGLGLGEILGIISGVVGLVGTVVAVTRYVDKLQADIAQSKSDAEIARLKDQAADLEAKYRAALSGGTAAVAVKNELDVELSAIATAVRARSSAILVPAPSRLAGGTVSELVFLSLQGPGSEKLRRTRVPLSSHAGAVFQYRKTRITHNATQESSRARQAEDASKASTSEMLAIPLLVGDRCVGVVEFLNKENGQFDASDQALAERLVGSLATKIASFTAEPENFRLLGMTPKEDAQDATVLFCDLTQSSQLFKDLDAATAIDLINEYFETICDAAMAGGATIDKFIGDGILIVFNARRPVPQHALAAAKVARQMQSGFAALKNKWTTFELPVAPLFNRVGISSGPVHRAEVGHPQYRELTVMGEVVNRAALLCEVAPRDRSVIVLDETVLGALSPQLTAAPLKTARAVGDLKAYELAEP